MFDQNKIIARAYILGQRLNLKAFREMEPIKKSPLMVAVGSGYAVLFRYGVVVLLGNKNDVDQQKFLTLAKEHVTLPVEDHEIEKVIVKKTDDQKDSVSFDGINLVDLDVDRLLVIADILAKSQILSLHESRVASAFDMIEPISLEMQQKGKLNSKRARDLLSQIASTLAAQRNMTGQAEILDKPDFLWDKPHEVERLYVKLEDEYEIRERHDALKEKLELIYKTSEMMLGLLNSRHSLNVEWYIVILIVIDIAIHIAETYVF